MTAGEPAATVTDADVRAFAAKLKGLHALLTPAEQTLLRTVLARAAAREAAAADETAGFAWVVSFNPFVYLDAITADRIDEERRGTGAASTERIPGITARFKEENDMTTITEKQQQQLEAVAERTAAKLKAFYDTLPADERAVLTVGLRHGLRGPGEQAEETAETIEWSKEGERDDVGGYVSPIVVGIGAGLVANILYDGLKSEPTKPLVGWMKDQAPKGGGPA